MSQDGGGSGRTKLVVAGLATLLWIVTSLVVAGAVNAAASVTAVNVGVPFLALLFAYHVFFHEGDGDWARAVAGLLAITGLVGLAALFVQHSMLTFVANALAILGMFALVAFLWR